MGLRFQSPLLLLPGLALVNLVFGRAEMVAPLMLIGATMIPFAFLNAPKAKVFHGRCRFPPNSVRLIGAAFVVPGYSNAPGYSTGGDWRLWVGQGVLGLVLIAELLPVPMQIFWVKVFKKRLFPFTPIHHAFEKAGWPETRVVASFALTQLLCTVGVTDYAGLPLLVAHVG